MSACAVIAFFAVGMVMPSFYQLQAPPWGCSFAPNASCIQRLKDTLLISVIQNHFHEHPNSIVHRRALSFSLG